MTAPERHLPSAAMLAAEGSIPPMRPRDAATLLLMRREKERVLVLAGRRSDKHKFMPGMYVFPGGRRDASDWRVPVCGSLSPEICRKLLYKAGSRMTPARMRALAVAALRETYEEVGLTIGGPVAGPQHLLPFLPDLGVLRFVGRAITPPGRTRRFDTRFFAAFAEEVDLDMSLLRPSAELERLEWVDIADTGRLSMPGITLTILAEIGAMLDISRTLSVDLPVPFYYMRRGRFIREEI